MMPPVERMVRYEPPAFWWTGLAAADAWSSSYILAGEPILSDVAYAEKQKRRRRM